MQRLLLLLQRVAVGVPGGLLLAWGLIAFERHALFGLSPRGLLLLPLWFFLATAIHEGGHILAGRAVGIRFPQWEIGPMFIDWQRRPVRMAWSWRNWASGGRVTARTTDWSHPAARFSFMIAAGPLASLVLCGGLYTAAWTWADALGRLAADLLLAFWSVSLIFFWSSLIPARTFGQLSDASLLWLLRRPSRARNAWLAQIRCLSALDAGLRPSGWPQEDIALLEQEPAGTGFEGALFLAYLSHQDRAACGSGGFSEATRLLEGWIRAVRHNPAVHRFAILEAIWHALFREKDEPRARAWLAALEEAPVRGAQPHPRGEFAVAILRAQPAEARAALQRYAELIDSLAHHPLAGIDRSILEEMSRHPLFANSMGGSGTIESQ